MSIPILFPSHFVPSSGAVWCCVMSPFFPLGFCVEQTDCVSWAAAYLRYGASAQGRGPRRPSTFFTLEYGSLSSLPIFHLPCCGSLVSGLGSQVSGFVLVPWTDGPHVFSLFPLSVCDCIKPHVSLVTMTYCDRSEGLPSSSEGCLLSPCFILFIYPSIDLSIYITGDIGKAGHGQRGKCGAAAAGLVYDLHRYSLQWFLSSLTRHTPSSLPTLSSYWNISVHHTWPDPSVCGAVSSA